MSAQPLTDFSRLAVHTFTTKPWNLAQACDNYAAAGIPGITVWRNVIEELGAEAAGSLIRKSGLEVAALCRGGFFPAFSAADRQKAIDDNKLAIDQAAAIGAPMVVLVCGAVVGMPLPEARKQVTDGIAACLDHARAAGVKLAIEPLHPMYAADRSAVNTMGQARAICEALQDPLVGIALDVYHVWWDEALSEEIRLAGEQNTLFAFHVCDWRPDTRHLLTDRGLMGEGCIDIKGIRAAVEAAGFNGWNEVEIFSEAHWAKDQRQWLSEIKQAYLNYV
ncbi:MAG: sugar phosphate isomerase/epimerase [Planctomycetota bacterium]|nr:MAG: sugar phosphate isomerase/epimerase [Planctomycetota bacterium]